MSSPNPPIPLQTTRKSIRKSILTSFQAVKAIDGDADGLNRLGIKVVPYIKTGQVLGITLLIIWPIILGTAFNIYGLEEASAYLQIRLDVQNYQQRVVQVQNVVQVLMSAQKNILSSLLAKDGQAAQVAGSFGRTAVQELETLDEMYPELSEHHRRVTPKKILENLDQWIKGVQSFGTVDPTDLVNNISEIIRGVRMFFSALHATSLQGGDTWNNVLQELFISEVIYRAKDVASFGDFSYRSVPPGGSMNEKQRLTLIRRYQRSLMALDLYHKYSMPQFQLDSLQKTCNNCSWTFLNRQKTSFWRDIVQQIVSLDRPTSLQAVIATIGLPNNADASTVYASLMKDSLFPIEMAQEKCLVVVGENFRQDLNVGAAVFAVTLAILIGWIFLTTNLLGLVATSLAAIFSESYRFQWVQLCRRRAIEREKSRSDKIVAEMFFEMNFKYLYEGNLPPTVLYKEATIAFVELLQYEELCKIYTTVHHVAILNWYYHLVAAALKGFNTNVVATAGHYCLLAGTHAHHAENVALSMLRLMTLIRESFLPPPHNSKLPLIRAGIHTGPVAGAIVSLKFPLFTMLGDTVNTAARMSSKSKAYCILLSEKTNSILAGNFSTQSAGLFNIKGKGQMNTYWLLSCGWQTFSGNFIDMEEADKLQEIHDLKVDHEDASLHQRRSGLRRSTVQSVFNAEGGRRRSSSVNDGSIAGLGDDLLQTFMRTKKRKKSKGLDRIRICKLTEPKVSADVMTTTRSTDALEKSTLPVAFVKDLNAKPTRVADAKKSDRGKLSTGIEVKASPNQSYYIQVANSIYTRSWKINQR